MRVLLPLLLAALAAAYLGSVELSRHQADERWQARRRAAQPAPNPQFETIYGGSAVKILQFYAREQDVAPGHATLLCYGVLNATSVHVDPPLENVHPALSYCAEVRPRQTTRYVLTAQGADGHTVSADLQLTVRRKP